MGAGTPEGSNMVNGHAYTVLAAYNVPLARGGF